MDRLSQIEGLTPADQEFLLNIGRELVRARMFHPHGVMLSHALSEEYGEVVKAYMDESWLRVVKEATQCASACIRFALEGDKSINRWRIANMLDLCPAHVTEDR